MPNYFVRSCLTTLHAAKDIPDDEKAVFEKYANYTDMDAFMKDFVDLERRFPNNAGVRNAKLMLFLDKQTLQTLTTFQEQKDKKDQTKQAKEELLIAATTALLSPAAFAVIQALYAAENPLFMQQASAFLAILNNFDNTSELDKKLKEAFFELYKNFIAEDAAQPVNIAGGTRAALSAAYASLSSKQSPDVEPVTVGEISAHLEDGLARIARLVAEGTVQQQLLPYSAQTQAAYEKAVAQAAEQAVSPIVPVEVPEQKVSPVVALEVPVSRTMTTMYNTQRENKVAPKADNVTPTVTSDVDNKNRPG